MLLLAFFAVGTIHVPAAYYTLRDLAQVLAKQGVTIDVRPNCADEVYAVRLEHESPEALMDIFRATGRLDVEPIEGGFRLRQAARAGGQAKTSVDRYLKADLADICRLREAAAKKVAYYLAHPLQTRQNEAYQDLAEARKAKRTDDAEVLQLVTNSFTGVGEGVYMDLKIPSLLMESGSRAIGNVLTARFADYPGVFFPEGMRDRTPPFQQTAFAQPIPYDFAGVKLRLDPLSGSATVPVFFGQSNVSNELDGEMTRPIFLRSTESGPPRPVDVLTPTEFGEYQARLKQTETELTKGNAEREVTLPARPLRVSGALLDLAEASDQDIVAYVSPFSDRVLAMRPKGSIRNLVTRVNAGDLDPALSYRETRERTGYGFLYEKVGLDNRTTMAYKPWQTLSAGMSGQTLVVRTETDFLDCLLSGPPTLPLDIENAIVQGKRPSLRGLAGHIATLKFRDWNSSLFSTHYLAYTNPTTFYPFARALVASPELVQKIEALGPDDRFDIAWSELDGKVRSEILEGLSLCAQRCDAGYDGFYEPYFMGNLARRGESGPNFTTLGARRVKGQLWMVLKHGHGELWSAWLDL